MLPDLTNFVGGRYIPKKPECNFAYALVDLTRVRFFKIIFSRFIHRRIIFGSIGIISMR